MPGYELIGKEERDAVNEVFDDGGVLFAHGFDHLRNNRYRVREFEKEFARSIGVKYAQALSSGTAAIKAGLIALGVKKGDEVITQSFTFVATVEAIIDIGAIPILVNIDETFNMDPDELEKNISSKTKVIIPVHMLGVSANLDPVMQIAKKHNIFVFDDNCEALGASWGDDPLGSQTDMCSWSFDFGKTITCGEGGMITTNNKEHYQLVREYHDHGHQYDLSLPRGLDTRQSAGFNFRMTEIQGAIGLAQLKKLDYIVKHNKKNYKIYEDSIKHYDFVTMRSIPKQCSPLFDTLIFSVNDNTTAKKIVNLLNKNNIGTKNIPDAIEWHFAKYWGHIFNPLGISDSELNKMTLKSAKILERSIAIPINVTTPENDIQKNAETLKFILSSI